MLQKPLFVLLLGLLLTGCGGSISDEQQRMDERRVFEGLMDRSVGQATYERVLGLFGPPSERTETASTITAVWEDPTGNGFRSDRVDLKTGGLSSFRGERVRMVFDRRTQLMKSWDYPNK
jgi:hypothetical protein